MSKPVFRYPPRPRTGLIGADRMPEDSVRLPLPPFVAPRLSRLSSSPGTSALAAPSPEDVRRSGVVTFCQCCGERSLHKRAVACEHEVAEGDPRPLAYLYACDRCGERYLALTYSEAGGGRVETWWYYVDRAPLLQRVARYEPAGAMQEQELVATDYLIGDRPVTEAAWKDALEQRRRVARARSVSRGEVAGRPPRHARSR